LPRSGKAAIVSPMRPLSREAFLLYAVISAAAVAFVVGHVAHFDLGFSRDEIRASALSGAAVIAAALFAGAFRGRRRD
jgi:hypothetical protein